MFSDSVSYSIETDIDHIPVCQVGTVGGYLNINLKYVYIFYQYAVTNLIKS